jgi:hypothetical protein
MATATSAYAVLVAYALILLSLWQVDLGLARSASSRPTAAPASLNVLGDSSLQLLNKLPFSDDQVARATVEKTEARRLATLALIAYVYRDGLKR